MQMLVFDGNDCLQLCVVQKIAIGMVIGTCVKSCCFGCVLKLSHSMHQAFVLVLVFCCQRLLD